MLLEIWFVGSSDKKRTGFDAMPFLKKLVTKGQYNWETPEVDGDEKLVTTLYLDGDMLCMFPEGQAGKPLELPPEVLHQHLAKIDHDLGTISEFANYIGLIAGFLATALTFALNPYGWIQNLIIISSAVIAGFFTRKLIKRILFKIFGFIAGYFLNLK
jgi:uncharacterized membrane protein YeaQ/YmgE (transglycosylase-associated protein family)